MTHDVHGVPATVGDDELIAAVRETASISALKELVRRRAPGRIALLTEVLADPSRPPDLRAAAAAQLGREPDHQTSLLAALSAPEPGVVRRAAEALGRTGNAAALDALAALRPAPGPVARSVDFGRTLIAYRLGLDRERLPTVDTLNLDPQAAHPLTSSAVPPELAAELAELAPGVALRPEAALGLDCDGDALVVLLGREPRDIAELLERSAVPAVVFRKPSGLEEYTIWVYVLTHGRSDGGVAVFGLTNTGRIEFAGGLEATHDAASFELHTAVTGATPPFAVAGHYEPARLKVELTLALAQRAYALEQQRTRRRPRRLTV